MSKRAVDPFMGVGDQRISDRGWNSSLNAPLAALQPHKPTEFLRCESALSCETSDEETCHYDHRMQNEIDPALGLQRPTHDASNSRSSVTSPTLETQATECGQQPSAANSRDRTGNSRPYKEPPRSEQLNEGVMPNTSLACSGMLFQLGVDSVEDITRNDGSTSDHDSIDLESQLITNSKRCVASDRDIYNKLFLLVGEEVRHAQIQSDTIASILSHDIPEFYQKRARPLNMQSDIPDNNKVWKIIMPILKDDRYDSDFKIKEVVEKVDMLYGGSGWVLNQEQATGISTGDSGYGENAGSTPISTPTPQPRRSIDNRSPSTPSAQHKHLMTKGEANTIPTPPPKRQRTAAGPSQLPITPSAQSESQPSPSRSTSNPTDIPCCEIRCGGSAKQNNMKRHYLEIHCPPKVWICPLKTDQTPCLYWSPRRSNFSTHFTTHNLTGEELLKAKRTLDGHALEVPDDFGHCVCPFCADDRGRQFSTRKACLNHMMTHYKDGSSAELSFTDLRDNKHDAKSVHDTIDRLVRQKVGRKRPKSTGKSPPDDQDDDNDDDSGQGGPPHGENPNPHERHPGHPSGNSYDHQRGGSGSNGGGREHDAGPGPSSGSRRRSQCHVKPEPSDSTALSSSTNTSDRGGRGPCLTYIGELGRGGFGVVDEVRCESTNQTYARKVVSSPHSPSSATSSEVRILKSLHHSHIIKLVDTWESQLGLSLLMSPVAKSDLAVYLHRAGAEPRTFSSFHAPEKQPLRNWIGCLSSALAYLHENGVIHGDIKPKNILISSDQIVYIADFGTAKCEEEASKTTARRFPALTPMYCAPEISNHQAAVLDYPADVFSLGCVWAEMATVYAGQSVQEFEKFRRLDSLDAAFHATIPRTLMWIDALLIPRESYDKCAHEFLKTIKDMLNFDPRKRPTMKNLSAHFRCSCSTRPLSSSQAPVAFHNQRYESANDVLLSTLQPLYAFPSWLWIYHEAIPPPYPINNHMGYRNKPVGPRKFNKTFKHEDGRFLPCLYENATFLAKCHALSLLWITSGASFGDRYLTNGVKPPETFVCLKMGEGDERLFENETTIITSCTARARTRVISSHEGFQQCGINNLHSLEDYFRDIPRPTTTQNISKLWRSVLGLVVALKFLQKGFRNKAPKFQSNLCHLSLKPANILVSSTKGDSPYSWRFGISDFGISQLNFQRADIEIDRILTERTYDCGDDYPTECDLCRCSQACESTSLAASLGCIYLQFMIWIADLKVEPDDRGRSRASAPDLFSKFQDTRKPRACEELILSHIRGPYALKEYLRNLGELSDPITKAVSKELISELLGVTSDKINLERLLQKADVMRQDWSQNCVGISQIRGDWHLSKKLLSVCSASTRHRNPSTASIDTEVPEKLLNEYDDLEYVMDGEMDFDVGPNGSPRTSSFDQGMEHYFWDRYGLESWLRDGRDFKSFSVMEYDPFQTARRELHEQLLRNAVNSCFSMLRAT